MALKLSTENQASAHGYENSLGQRGTDVELAHVDVNVYDTLQQGDTDEHAYSVVSKVQASSEVTLSRRSVIILVVSGVILSAVISIISGVVVYHVTNGKQATQTDPEITSNTNNVDALAMDVKSLKTDINQLNDVWRQQLSSLSNESRDFQMDTKNQLATINNDINGRLDTINDTSRDINGRLETLNSASRVFQMDTKNQLDTLTNALRDTNDRLDTINDTPCDTNDQLGTSNNTACATKNQLDSLTNSLRDTKNQLETVRSLVQSVQEKQNSSDQQVAFTARGATGNSVNSVLTFKNVDLNLGGGYNQTTGTFTCHVAGTYLFSARLMSVLTRSSQTYCRIRKNGSSVVIVYSREGSYDSASVSALFHLSVGNLVDLGGCVNVNYINTADGWTSFTGSLIQAD